MTNPTPPGQVPAIQRYKIGYASDEWGMRSSTPGAIRDAAGKWMRYEDHAAAIAALRTQQPAPAGFVPVAAFDRLHAQAESLAARLLAAPQQEVQEPYGWLYDWTHSSATGKPDTSYTGFTKDFAHAQKHDNCIAVYTAQQPAPSAAAPCPTCNDQGAVGNILTAEPCPDCTRWNAQPAPANQQAGGGWQLVPIDVTDDMLAEFAKGADSSVDWHGATEAERQDVRDGFGPAYRAMLAAAPQPSPTAQAASSAVLKAIREANMQLVRTGDDAFMLVPYKVATAQAAESVPAPVLDSLLNIVIQHEARATPAEVRSMAAELATYRAARAPAESVTAPAATVIKKGADRQWMSERLGHLHDGIHSLYLAPPTQAADYDHGPQSENVQEAARHVGKWLNERPNHPLDLRDVAMLCAHAQAADSVLEDVALLRARHEFLLWNRSLQPSPIESSVEYSVFDKALELYDAARKQGANHD